MMPLARPILGWHKKALTRAGRLAESKISDINALKLTCSNLLHGEKNHSVSSEPYFYDTSYTNRKLSGPIPVDHDGRCVVTEKIG